MKRFLKLVLVLYCFFLTFGTYAQSVKKRKAEKNFDNYSFYAAIEDYEQISDKDVSDFRRLAESYRYTGNTSEAEKNYKVCVDSDEQLPEDVYYYAAMLRSNGKYEESDQWMDKYHLILKSDSRGEEYFENHGMTTLLLRDQGQYSIFNLDVNSAQEDFGAVYYKDKIVFASSREGTKSIRRRWNWNQLPFLDLYQATPDQDGQLSELVDFNRKLNDKFHEGPASFAKDYSFIAFTRNNYSGTGEDGVVRLQIFTQEFVDGKWTNELAFPYNNPEYSIGHAALSKDGMVMYFASDMPGGYGGVDLYRTSKTNDGWSKPENLGKEINTEGNEMFPFLHSNNTLFFASDGHIGLGGLDNFLVQIKEDNSFEKILNMGYPINDKRDDFALVVNDDFSNGYFSSNRPGGKGDDDLYSFTFLKPLKLNQEPEIVSYVTNSDGSEIDHDSLELHLLSAQDGQPDLDYKYQFRPEDKQYELEDVDWIQNWEPEKGVNQQYTMLKKNDVFYSQKVKYNETDHQLETKFNLDENPAIIHINMSDISNDQNVDNLTYSLVDNETNDTIMVMPGTSDFKFGVLGKKPGDLTNYNLIVSGDGYETSIIPINKPFPDNEPLEINDKVYPIGYGDIILAGRIFDKSSGDLLESVDWTITDRKGPNNFDFKAIESTTFYKGLREVRKGDTLFSKITVRKEGYKPLTLNIVEKIESDTIWIKEYMLKNELDVLSQVIEANIKISPIYFDLDKSNIRTDAKEELDKIVQLMNENPNMVIEFGSHTDCRASYSYNEALSQRRAISTADYIKSRITNPSRIYGEGYGERRLAVDCPCEGPEESDCSEEKHQLNRRSEFKIIRQ